MGTFQDLIKTNIIERKELSKEDKLKNIQNAIKTIEKDYGKGSIGTLDDKYIEFPHIPSGIMSFDLAIGIGGLPKGRIIELFGSESSGKSTLALSIAAMAQKLGGFTALIDAEHAYDPKWGAFIGVNNEEFLVSQPNDGEESLEILESLVKTNSMDVIIVDSVSALVPRAELEGDMGQAHMALQARLMSQAMRKLTASVSKSKTIVIFINQTRDGMNQYGGPETSGGKALKFYSSVRGQVYRKEILKKGDESIGIKTRVKFVKNKVSTPFKECEYDLYYDTGIDYEGSIISEAVKWGIIPKSGAWYPYDGQNFQGEQKLIEYLKQYPDKIVSLREEIMKLYIEKNSKVEQHVELEEKNSVREIRNE